MFTVKQNVIDLSSVVDNLYDYIKANQSEVLEIAYGKQGLPDFQKFYTSAAGRVATVFPCLTLISQDLAETSDDAIEGVLTLNFEAVLQGGDTDETVSQGKAYDKAMRLMLANIESQTLMADADNHTNATLIALASDLFTAAGKSTAYLQVLKIQAIYKLRTSSYN